MHTISLISFVRKVGIILLLVVFANGIAQGQIKQPVKWNISVAVTSPDHASITFTATIESPWHVYSQTIDPGGPIPTTFNYVPTDEYELIGKTKSISKPIKKFDETFQMPLEWFEKTAVFVQDVKLNKPGVAIHCAVEFMTCNDMECLPPTVIEFDVEVKNQVIAEKKVINVVVDSASKTDIDSYAGTSIKKPDDTVKSDSASVKMLELVPAKKSSTDLWAIFIAGFLGGLAAFLMPCIFPMVPFIIGGFSKAGEGNKSKFLAVIFGVSIVVIYVSTGLLVTIIFGSDALNALATNGAFNIFFFLLLLLFAASFMGAFEITLPSSWVNKIDSKAEKGGLLGIFFMAATLALVSFSCTGPIIGTLLVETSRLGELLGPMIGMLGFSLALALPFTVFAMFPMLLKSLPKSGQWMNSLKVTLGFLELALALKFLSNVDLAYHWEWFDREVFLTLWIIIFGSLGFYLLGKIRLPHDKDVNYISPARLFISIITLSFTLYMVPGLWGAPLKAIAAFLPPQQTQDFDLYTENLGSSNGSGKRELEGGKKYSNLFHAPHNLNAFFDYEEGLAYAKKVSKPIMIDFTGHACVNCRKMEATIWTDPNILELLNNEFVLIQLYVDDKTLLPENEQTVSTYSGKQLKTIGSKWSDFQADRYNSNSQPYYVLLDQSEKLLVPPMGANYDANVFKDFLNSGIQHFKASY